MEGIQKLRPLYIAKTLYERTDEDHCLTTLQIEEILRNEYSIDAYRKTITTDIALLQQFGMDIEVIKSTQNKYHLLTRKFDLPELKLLIDAVESSKFITKKKSQELVSKIETLSSVFHSDKLTRHVDVENRLKAGNEQIYYIIDVINDAINQSRKISFLYYHYNVKKEKKLKNSGQPYIFSPYKLVWNGDRYYVVGYSDKHKEIGSFRVDRIFNTPAMLDEAIVVAPEYFDINRYLNATFGMYNGEIREVDLICKNEVIDAIIDRFGEDVKILAYDMESFRAIVKVSISHIFYSWVFGFGGKVFIQKPQEIKDEYTALVNSQKTNW